MADALNQQRAAGPPSSTILGKEGPTPDTLQTIFAPYGIKTQQDIQNLSKNIRNTGSVWTRKENSFSGVDVKVFLNIYTGQIRDKMAARITAQIEEAQDIYRNPQRRPNITQTERLRYGDHIRTLQRELEKVRQGEVPAFLELGECQTVSISTHRDKLPVRALGSVGPRGFTRSARSLAGTMIFTVFNQHPLARVLYGDFYSYEGYNKAETENHFELPDQLPPMDLTMLAANEYGYITRIVLYGLEFVNEGMTISVEDLITETQLQYVARDFDPPRPIEGADPPKPATGKAWSLSASDLTRSADYEKFKRRQNPFM